MTLEQIKRKKPNVNPLLLLLLQGLEDKNHQIQFNDGSFTFFPQDAQWKNLQDLGLITNKGFLTNLGKRFVYQSPAVAMDDKMLIKTLTLLIRSFNQRGLIITGDMYEAIATMVNNFNIANVETVETVETIEAVEKVEELEKEVEKAPKKKRVKKTT